MRDHLATPAPWLAFPEHPPGSLFWKMGGGSDYLAGWTTWFVAQSNADRGAYLSQFAPPEGWSGYVEYGIRPSPVCPPDSKPPCWRWRTCLGGSASQKASCSLPVKPKAHSGPAPVEVRAP